MIEFEIIKEKTCAFSGHRILGKDFNLKLLKDKIYALLTSGYDTFLVGMALGFDTVCFQVLEYFRREYNIKIVACVPCRTQAERFGFKDKEEYFRMLKAADEKIFLSDEYTPYCMMKRNMFMVDMSSSLIVYLRSKRGGTFNTLKYAEKISTNIIRI